MGQRICSSCMPRFQVFWFVMWSLLLLLLLWLLLVMPFYTRVLEQMFMFVYLCMRASVGRVCMASLVQVYMCVCVCSCICTCIYKCKSLPLTRPLWCLVALLISITKLARVTCYHNWRTWLKILCKAPNKAETEQASPGPAPYCLLLPAADAHLSRRQWRLISWPEKPTT